MTDEWLTLAEAARHCGLTERHMRRVVLEARRGLRNLWKTRRVIWRDGPDGFEVALATLPQEACESWLISTYHLNLALPDPGTR